MLLKNFSVLNKPDSCPSEVQRHSKQPVIQELRHWQELPWTKPLVLGQVPQQTPPVAAHLISLIALSNTPITGGISLLKIHLPLSKVPNETIYYRSVTSTKLWDASPRASRSWQTYLPAKGCTEQTSTAFFCSPQQ